MEESLPAAFFKAGKLQVEQMTLTKAIVNVINYTGALPAVTSPTLRFDIMVCFNSYSKQESV